MARLQACPYVVQLLDKFESEQEVHLVTELCRGGDLRQVVEVSPCSGTGTLAVQTLNWMHLMI